VAIILIPLDKSSKIRGQKDNTKGLLIARNGTEETGKETNFEKKIALATIL